MSNSLEVSRDFGDEQNKELLKKESLKKIIVSYLSKKRTNLKKIKNDKNFLMIKQKLTMKKNSFEALAEIQKELINSCNQEEKG